MAKSSRRFDHCPALTGLVVEIEVLEHLAVARREPWHPDGLRTLR